MQILSGSSSLSTVMFLIPHFSIQIKKDVETATDIILCTVFDFGKLDGNRPRKYNAECLTNDDKEYYPVTINATIRQPATSGILLIINSGRQIGLLMLDEISNQK